MTWVIFDLLSSICPFDLSFERLIEQSTDLQYQVHQLASMWLKFYILANFVSPIDHDVTWPKTTVYSIWAMLTAQISERFYIPNSVLQENEGMAKRKRYIVTHNSLSCFNICLYTLGRSRIEIWCTLCLGTRVPSVCSDNQRFSYYYVYGLVQNRCT